MAKFNVVCVVAEAGTSRKIKYMELAPSITSIVLVNLLGLVVELGLFAAKTAIVAFAAKKVLSRVAPLK